MRDRAVLGVQDLDAALLERALDGEHVADVVVDDEHLAPGEVRVLGQRRDERSSRTPSSPLRGLGASPRRRRSARAGRA